MKLSDLRTLFPYNTRWKKVSRSGCHSAAAAAAVAKYKAPGRFCSPKEVALASPFGGACEDRVAGATYVYTFNFSIRCGETTESTRYFQAACVLSPKGGPSISNVRYGNHPGY